MYSYTKHLETIYMKSSISMSEFEEIERMNERVHESMEVSSFGLKNFLIGFVVNPIIVIALAGLWYWLGFRLSSVPLVAKIVISLAAFLSMIYFGYVYQPYVHMLAFVAGLLRWPPIAYRRHANPDRPQD